MSVSTIPMPARASLAHLSREAWVARAAVVLLVAWLFLSIALPLWALLSKSFQNQNGALLALANARLYEVADALGTKKSRIFRTVTLPGAKFGLINAAFVVFTLVVTDFGIAKVIGGQFNVLATDAYKQVVGQQNFEMGAVVGMVLLVPAVAAFVIDRMVQRRQVALLSARAVPLEPKPNALRDLFLTIYCLVIAALIVGVIGVTIWASFITYWPYNLALTFRNYIFGTYDPGGWS